MRDEPRFGKSLTLLCGGMRGDEEAIDDYVELWGIFCMRTYEMYSHVTPRMG